MSPLLIAHRGASFDAPENTLAAFRLAWEQNADGAEGDVLLTRDGQIVCIHDADTQRTGAINLPVTQSSLEELQQVDVGSRKHPKYVNEIIPTLDQVLALVPAGKRFYIEIKCGPDILTPLQDVIARAPVEPQQLRIISFDAVLIAQTRKCLPNLKTHWISDYEQDPSTGALIPTHESILQTLQEIRADGFNSSANLEVLTQGFVAQLKSAALEIAAWTVDDPALARSLIRAGVGALTTNRPGWLREQLRR